MHTSGSGGRTRAILLCFALPPLICFGIGRGRKKGCRRNYIPCGDTFDIHASRSGGKAPKTVFLLALPSFSFYGLGREGRVRLLVALYSKRRYFWQAFQQVAIESKRDLLICDYTVQCCRNTGRGVGFRRPSTFGGVNCSWTM